MLSLYLKFEKPITNFEIALQKIFFYGVSFTIMTKEPKGHQVLLSNIGVDMSKLSHNEVLDKIKFGLIASCQPVDDGPMDKPEIVAAMAQASVIGGAAGLRIEGVDNLKATRPTVNVPIIGIVKRDLPDSPVRITPFLHDIEDLAKAGADIIAVDGTNRPRPVDIESAVKKIHELGCLAMADCSNLGCRVMAEGRYNTPELAKTAIEIGAYCVTVGSALTRLEHIVSWFAQAIHSAKK